MISSFQDIQPAERDSQSRLPLLLYSDTGNNIITTYEGTITLSDFELILL